VPNTYFVKTFLGAVALVTVVAATVAFKMLAWRFVRQVDQARREQLRAQGKVGLLSPERWRRD
jgi:membrane protein implicated in regulation of membrane protease activity